MTPLQLAVEGGHIEMIEYLLKQMDITKFNDVCIILSHCFCVCICVYYCTRRCGL